MCCSPSATLYVATLGFTVDWEIFMLIIICIKNFRVDAFLWSFYLQNFLVDAYNMDECLERS